MMEIEVVGGEMASFDADLLQLPEFSQLALKSNPHLAEELFSIWLSLPETNKLVHILNFLFYFIYLFIHPLSFSFFSCALLFYILKMIS